MLDSTSDHRCYQQSTTIVTPQTTTVRICC